MKPQEAINIIEDVTWQDNGRHYGKIVPAREIAISALEKQIPKKPTPQVVKGGKRLIGNGWWCKGTTVYKCPCCNEFISRIYDYCYKCGQALDWGDGE